MEEQCQHVWVTEKDASGMCTDSCALCGSLAMLEFLPDGSHKLVAAPKAKVLVFDLNRKRKEVVNVVSK